MNNTLTISWTSEAIDLKIYMINDFMFHKELKFKLKVTCFVFIDVQLVSSSSLWL
jgi:hypothetical protein